MAKTKVAKSDYYVYSTLANDNIYRNYQPGGGDMPIPQEGIFIKGGANLADYTGLVTPKGVVTGVTEAELSELRSIPSFVLHEKNGFIAVSKLLEDADDVAEDMEAADGSAPLTPEALDPAGPTPADVTAVAARPAPAANPRKA